MSYTYSLTIRRVAKNNDIAYDNLLHFIYANRYLTEFQRIIDKYKLERTVSDYGERYQFKGYQLDMSKHYEDC